MILAWGLFVIAALAAAWYFVQAKRTKAKIGILEQQVGRLRKANQEQAAIIREYELSDNGRWMQQVQAWWDDE